MALDPDFLSSLVCPDNREPLKLAEGSLVDRVNAAIKDGRLKNRAGQTVSTPLDAGLLRADGGVLYPVWDDIPNLLVDEGIDVKALA